MQTASRRACSSHSSRSSRPRARRRRAWPRTTWGSRRSEPCSVRLLLELERARALGQLVLEHLLGGRDELELAGQLGMAAERLVRLGRLDGPAREHLRGALLREAAVVLDHGVVA